MFKQRLLTTIFLMPIVLVAIFYVNIQVFDFIVLLLILACGLEWLQLIPIHHVFGKILLLFTLLLSCYLIRITYHYWLFAGLMLWVVIAIFITQFPKLQNIWGRPWIVGFFCLMLLPLFAESMIAIFLMKQGKLLIVYLLCLTWAADIGAYVVGKRWGRHKLIPSVSPGKTVEGAIGGFLLVMLVALVGCYYLRPNSRLYWFITALLISFITLLGDLFISMLKRRSHIKDTGCLLPGHGGVLDRLDSLIASAPFLYCSFYLLAPGL